MSGTYPIKSVDDYIALTGLNPNSVFSKEEATKILNEHVISFYKGRVKLREEKDFTGAEIVEKLHFIEKTFIESMEKSLQEIEEEEEN